MSENETSAQPQEPVKRKRGRPRKNPVEREAMREPQGKRWKMRANPNWEDMDATSLDVPDRYRVPPHMVPDGMSLQWVTSSVFGQDVPQHRSNFERNGWTPIHQDDFDGQFDGMFMPKGKTGEVTVDGLTLMARPKEITDRAKHREVVAAYEQVAIKEKALRGGDLPISLDASHPSAIKSNRITKSLERVEIPEK